MARLLSEQEILRRESLSKLRALGIDPYPAAEYKCTHFAKDIRAGYSEGVEGFEQVRIAGRLMTIRIMGKASFAVLADSTGEMQIYINRDEICPEEDKTMYNDVFKKLLDIGDFIGVEGHLFTTQTGEMSLHVKELVVLSKSLRPLPVVKKDADGNVYDKLTDPEIRYRQRYVDLVVNPDVKEIFRKRNKVISTMRRIFDDAGYMEVETPILQAIPGGAAARPFITHHNALDIPLYLRIANELYLKRLIVGGFEGVYEFAKDFRNEGMDRTHNPEFSQMELYVAYKDYKWMMDKTEEMFRQIANDVNGTTEVVFGGKVIDFGKPFERLSIFGGIEKYTGIDVSEMSEVELRETAVKLNVPIDDSMG